MQYAKRVVPVTQCLLPMCYLGDNCLNELREFKFEVQL